VSEHTPGPWKIYQNPFEIWTALGPGYGLVAHVAAYCPPREGADDHYQECVSNACLIAAAPDLLEACRCMHKLLTDMGHGGLAGAILGENAISKAHGSKLELQEVEK
jgi:hypothetical protein